MQINWPLVVLCGALGGFFGAALIDVYRKYRKNRPPKQAITGYNEGAADEVLDEIIEEGNDEVESSNN